MADLEKVIKGLSCCEPYEYCTEKQCPYYKCAGCMDVLINDALELLKAQDPKPVELYGKDEWYGLVCVCPDCKAEWMSDESDTHFCPNCGKAVKWDD